MGIAKRGGQCLTGIYLNCGVLNIKIFVKYLRLVPDKLTETKKLREPGESPLREGDRVSDTF